MHNIHDKDDEDGDVKPTSIQRVLDMDFSRCCTHRWNPLGHHQQSGACEYGIMSNSIVDYFVFCTAEYANALYFVGNLLLEIIEMVDGQNQTQKRPHEKNNEYVNLFAI